MNIPPILCLSINHRTAPVALREQLHCTLAALLLHLPAAAANEIALLTTCNRLEIYACLPQPASEGHAALVTALAQTAGLDAAAITPHLVSYSGEAAAAHLYRVAAGLDSLVLGEPQILGQVTDAYETATALRAVGPRLKMLFQGAIRAGKRIRTKTAISHNPASISSVALNLAQRQLGRLVEKHLLVVGLGQMGQLTVKALRARGVKQVTLINRGRARADILAHQYNYRALPLENLPQSLAEADLVLCATGATHPLITQTMVAEVMIGRESRPLLALDLGVPRNIEPAIHTIPGVHLYNLDDLQGNLDEALEARQQEIPKVEQIITAELAQLHTAWQTLPVQPLITDLRQKAERIRQRELARVHRRLGNDVDPVVLHQLHHFSQALVNQLLHEPTSRLRQEPQQYQTVVRDLFGLEEV